MTATDVHTLADELRARRAPGFWRSRRWRLDQLDGLSSMMSQNITLWEQALAKDLGKSDLESHLTEISVVLEEVRLAKRNLWRWMLPHPKPVPASLQPAWAHTVRDPLGAVLVIAPWNYPLQLSLAPLVGAIAGGNSAVVKPSELAPATSELLARLAPIYLDSRAVQVVEGAVEETTALLEQRWDLIFYTGNGRVARIVAAAAAKHLTPTVLELGGKSPVYVDASANLKVSARRLAWAKSMNAGQTCIAPDYVLVHESVREPFVEEFRQAVLEQLGSAPATNAEYATIVNERHFDRLRGLMDSGTRRVGGGINRDELRIEPTVLTDVDPDSPVMAEEIFGPILPIIDVAGVEEAIDFVTERDKPLALYVYAEEAAVIRRFQRETTSGALGVNVSLAHAAVPGLPFGGVGESGMGAYHGRKSFEAFTHEKGVLAKPTQLDTLQLIYPPHSEGRRKLLRRLFR